jgi:pleiotropic regulator 1
MAFANTYFFFLVWLGDNGSMSFWDWKSGHRFQSLDTTAQPGSLDAEAGIMSSTFDKSGLRLICGEADKTSESFSFKQLSSSLMLAANNFLSFFFSFTDRISILAVKIWRPDDKATSETHPVEWTPALGRRKF